MNILAIAKSGLLGLGVGLALTLLGITNASIADRLLNVLVAGAVGLVIGALTEWLTSLLPLRIARTKTFFLINNAIAVAVSALVTALLVLFAAEEFRDRVWVILAVVIVIVCIGNLLDYLLYRRAQRRLRATQLALGAPEANAVDQESVTGSPPTD